MKTITAASAAIALLSAQAFAQTYDDTPTSAWFKGLSSHYSVNCCDQADCATANSEWRGTPPYIDETGKLAPGVGDWWAQSNRTGQWLMVSPDLITKETDGSIRYSVFAKAVLCEAVPPASNAHPQAQFYCFAPPPNGF